MAIEYDENAYDVKLSDPRYKEIADEVQKKLWYILAQTKRTRNTSLLVKSTAYAIIQSMYEYDAMQDGRQAAENYKKGYIDKGIEELTKGEAPF